MENDLERILYLRERHMKARYNDAKNGEYYTVDLSSPQGNRILVPRNQERGIAKKASQKA